MTDKKIETTGIWTWRSARDAIGGLLIVIAAIWAVVQCTGPSELEVQAQAKAEADRQAAEDLRCRQDLSCSGEKGVVAASVYCKAKIESLARGAVKWTDTTFESKFTHYRWKDKPAGVITYIGDRAQFQNGFGAFINVIYQCDMGPDRQTVFDVRVEEGRMR